MPSFLIYKRACSRAEYSKVYLACILLELGCPIYKRSSRKWINILQNETDKKPGTLCSRLLTIILLFLDKHLSPIVAVFNIANTHVRKVFI